MTSITKHKTEVEKSLSYGYPLFTAPRKNGQYLFDRLSMSAKPGDGNIVIPLVVDTEYVARPRHELTGFPTIKYSSRVTIPARGRLGLTTQVKGIHESAPSLLLAHGGVHELLPRMKLAQSEFHPVDYLVHCGHDAKIERTDRSLKGLPVADFILYAHFALAELYMISHGNCREDLLEFSRQRNPKMPRFEMERKLRCSTPGSRGAQDHIDLPWVLYLNGQVYAVRLTWVDSSALHGMSSYKDVCAATGVKLDAKDNFSSTEKSDMLTQAIDRPDDFDAYALGDLHVYDALSNNAENFRAIYRALGIEEKFVIPRLTIGSTIRDLFEAVLFNKIGVSDPAEIRQVRQTLMEPASAGHLRESPHFTRALASKVEGGRCRNNRPTDRHVDSAIVDLDISGCYGEGQRNQLYPLGKPEVMDYAAGSNVNQYMTLRQWLKLYDGDLVSGLWFARVCTVQPLKHRQDYLASWFSDSKAGDLLALAKYAANKPSDTELESVDEQNFNEEDGSLKIFNHEIFNGVVTHETVQWLQNVCSKEQRAELLDNLFVITSMVYPASWRVETYAELKAEYTNHKGRNKVTRTGKGKRKNVRFTDGECHAWVGFNIGELIIDTLLSNRKLYDKKTPLNTLFKLCVNTLYGDMTSKHFVSANVVVGNNITARARALAWYMEKGLYGFQTVTDGCAFELNRVSYPVRGSLTAQRVVNLYRAEDTQGENLVKLAPIGGWKYITLKWVALKDAAGNSPKDDNGKDILFSPQLLFTGEGTVYDDMPFDIVEDGVYTLSSSISAAGKEVSPVMAWVNRAAMEHLRSLFPKVDVLHAESTTLKAKRNEDGSAEKIYLPRLGQFEFEAKDFYDSATLHGSANYFFENPKGRNLKARAYETKKTHESYELREDGQIIITCRYDAKNNPASDLLTQLSGDDALSRQDVFTKEAILKNSDYRNRQETWDALGLVPGDSFLKPGLMREFSLSQFTFKDWEQYRAWTKEITRAKSRNGQSIEGFFINEDGTLDFDDMLQTVDHLIAEGCMKPFAALDANRHRQRDRPMTHPSWQTYQAVRERLNEVIDLTDSED